MSLPESPKKINNENEPIKELKNVILVQQVDLETLNSMVEAMKDKSFSSKDIEIFYQKADQLTDRQNERFNEIDSILNDYVIASKKGKPMDHKILTYGKEVRKIEAGIRTLKLFLYDMIDMLNPELTTVNRLEDRAYYFKHRHQQILDEIASLKNQMHLS